VPIDSLEHLDVAWTPAPDAFWTTPVGGLARRLGVSSFAGLAERLAQDPGGFWGAVSADLGVPWTTPFTQALDLTDGPAWPRFFAGGTLNAYDLAVGRWSGPGGADRIAVRWYGEPGEERSVSYGELQDQVARAATVLRDLGVAEGDAVGIFLPMIPEAVVAILAAVAIGAIAVPMFSGYGPEAVRARGADAALKVLVTCDGFPRRGRMAGLKQVADAATAALPGLSHVLVVRRAGLPVAMTERDLWWDEVLGSCGPAGFAPRAYPAETPCLLLYTSGSTGRPKGCVHTHSGLPLQVAAEARYGLGVDESSRVLWLTDMGWVMGPWLVFGSLVNGATAVLFEGVPDYPAPDRLWAVAAEAGVTVLGVAPTVVRSLMAAGQQWPRRHDLARLRAIGSTGEPWNLDPWWWCFRNVGRERVPIVNICGGTECGGSILSGSIARPVKPMSFAGPAVGMAADVVGPDGSPVRGEVGELVVRQPWPGMTRGFRGDGERYLDAYWRRFPGWWHHGDFAYVDQDGYWYVLGRSDETIKVAGKRLGPAEVESAVHSTGLAVESAAVGLPHPVKGQELACFVVLADRHDQSAVEQIRDSVQRHFGKAFRPGLVLAVSSLPKTRNGKIMRRVVRAAYLGEPPGDLSTLEDPAPLAELAALRAAAARPVTT
jgi:acetyl-CoA synthetase